MGTPSANLYLQLYARRGTRNLEVLLRLIELEAPEAKRVIRKAMNLV
jgi:hypothetical protein